MGDRESILKDRSFDFALAIISVYNCLVEKKKEYVLSKQLLRSGTSVGANIREAQNARSAADFIHKLYISQKECDETLYWLELLFQSYYIEDKQFDDLTNQATSILKMIKSAILTTKQKWFGYAHHS